MGLSFKVEKIFEIFFVIACCFWLIGCAEKSITIEKKGLSIVSVTLNKGEEIFDKDVFLRFDFTTDEPLLDIVPDPSMLQLRVMLTRNGNTMYHSIASSPFLIKNDGIGDIYKNRAYSAYFFKSLTVDSDSLTKPLLVQSVNYENLDIKLVYPVMGLGTKYKSNVISYSKKDMENIFSQSISVDTLLISQ